MMNNNKILTVSYGTFSCTLEGFDDSFGTMKAIAEYFRDLASDDRYFGAEPPQPDAEMLARIAEREISRRVEARQHEGRIVLSAGDQDTVQAPVPATPPVVAAAAVADAPARPEQDTAVVLPTEDTPPVTPELTDDSAEDSAVTPSDVAEPEVDESVVPAAAIDDEHIDPVAIDDTPEEPLIPSDVDVAEDTAEAFFALGHDDDARDAYDDDASDDGAHHVAEAAEVAPDSIAAKLQRIRAVVSQSQDEAEDEDMFEDEHADDFVPVTDATDHDDPTVLILEDNVAPEAIVDQAVSDIEDLQDHEDAQIAEAEAAQDDDDDLGAILARFDGDPVEADIVTTAEDITNEDDSDVQEDGHDTLGLDTLAALMAEDEDEDTDDQDAEVGENLFDETVSDEDEEPDAPLRRARVIKVKRADIDAAIASGHLEEIDDETDEDDAFDPAETSLSPEDEAELMAELAQVESEGPAEAETADVDTSHDDSDDEVAEEAAPQEAAVLEGDVEDAEVKDDDVTRLMAEADNQMEEPESSRRRSAFAHLKAAVMAKKADAGIGKDSQEDEGAFRSDLASVVKPRRPEVRSDRGQRPEGTRPAPLKLVAEQRVDVDLAPTGPVRPRRVAAVDDAAHSAENAGSFAEFASDMGAHDLPDLLEAAASYLSFVEGRDQFSRPQLMTKVRQVEQGDFSREDGLRSFGQLLRAGKIEKIKGGRFAVTGDIGYRPDQRAAS